MFKLGNTDLFAALSKAMKENDETAMKAAVEAFQQSVSEQIHADFQELADEKDVNVLASRGYRQLTTKEKTWYGKVISAMKSTNPKQAFVDIISDTTTEGAMPSTIVEDVFRHLQEDHPLLGAISFQYVGYLTKWVTNDHSTQRAYWGEITADIEKEITSSIKVIDVKQHMLSAFAVIELGMLDLGPMWLDAYIRACLYEALYCGSEQAVVGGNGVNCPIGLDRDIHEGVTFSTTDGYPQKTPEIIHDFKPETYGPLVAKLAKTEKGKKRTFSTVGLICNLSDYLTKIMPATTYQASDGSFKNNLFPFPTTVIISNEVDDGRAILFVPEEYQMFVGGDKAGSIVYDDSVKFFQNSRAFRVVQYATGRAFDNTSAILLNIADMDPAYLTVVQETKPVHYGVTLAAMTDGTATSSRATAKSGETVTITAKPAAGKALDTITATYGASTSVTVTTSGNVGTFTMPADDVTVTVTFKAAA